MPRDEAIAAIKKATEKTYARKGKEVVKKNFEAIDAAVANLFEVEIPAAATGDPNPYRFVPDTAPEFVRNVTSAMSNYPLVAPDVSPEM